MSMFVEVFDTKKECPIIINLDMVVEFTPLIAGGTAIWFPDASAVGGKTPINVKENYTLFKQFVMTTVSEVDIAARISNLPKVEKEPFPRVIPTPEDTPKTENKGGRPTKAEQARKSGMMTTADLG